MLFKIQEFKFQAMFFLFYYCEKNADRNRYMHDVHQWNSR